MSLESRLQRLSMSPQPTGSAIRRTQVVPGSRGGHHSPSTSSFYGSSGSERTYINVGQPVAVASRRGGVLFNPTPAQLPSRGGGGGRPSPTPSSTSSNYGGGREPRPTSANGTPAIPHSQAVKRFIEPSYSTMLQLSQSNVPSESAIYANCYSEMEAPRSSDSQGSTEEELAAAAAAVAAMGGYMSPPSPVSSSYSELRQATRGVHMGHVLVPASQTLLYDPLYEPVRTHHQNNSTMTPPTFIYEGQEYGDFFGTCSKCARKIVGEGTGCSAMGRLYHIRCFTCHNCHCQLQGKPFYALDGKPFCETDYLNTLEKCCKCQCPILDRILRATGKPYHPQCFTCVVCGKSLDGVPFTVDATNAIHCIEDFHRRFAPRCSVCRHPIMPEPGLEETVRVVALDRSFHVQCYKCEDCGLLLSSEAEGRGCYPLDDHVLCKGCNTQRIQLLTQGITSD